MGGSSSRVSLWLNSRPFSLFFLNTCFHWLNLLVQSAPFSDGLRARFLFVGTNMDVAKLVETTLAGMGYELVDLELSGRGLMRVFMDKPDGITVEDCERVSNQLVRLFTVEGVDYERLEVSSPGLDRVLKKEADFVRFAGQKAQIKVRVPMEGRKNFVGILGETKDGGVQLDLEGSLVTIELSNIDKARLVPVF
jgi:ribosome maturation factor RimP